ncbi:MAG: hypothetical protein ABWW70_04540 [Thermoproteota archaeon]
MAGSEECRRIGGVVGTWASIIAGLIIIYVLWAVYAGGVEAAFRPPTLYAMAGLILSGIFALLGYIYYAVSASWHMRRLSPIALGLGALAVVAGYKAGVTVGGGLVVAAYLVEFLVGYKLYLDFKRDAGSLATFFLAGVVVFMGGLPFILLWRPFALVSLVGDAVKVVGLTLILARLYSRGALPQQPPSYSPGLEPR